MLVIATSLARFCALGEIVNGFALYLEKKKKASHRVWYLWFFFSSKRYRKMCLASGLSLQPFRV